MTRTSPDEIATALDCLAWHDYGRVRTARAQRLVELAELAGDRPVLVRALQALVESACFDVDNQHMIVPFTRVLTMWRDRPGDFDDGTRARLHWQFKWVGNWLLDRPVIPLEQIDHWLAEFHDRYAEAGWSLRPVHQARLNLAQHVGDREAAARAYADWVTAPRDAMADCEACECSERGWWLNGQDRDREALEAWEPVLSGSLSCHAEPSGTQSAALLPLVRLGDGSRARALHLVSYRSGRRRLRSAVGRNLTFAALTGNEARGLEILADHADWLRPGAHAPLRRAYWLVRVVHLLRRVESLGYGDVPVGAADADGGTTTAARLAPRLAAEVAELGAAFDARNGTSAVTEDLQEILTAEPLVDHLPLGVVGGAPALRRATASPARPRTPAAREAPEAILDRARRAGERDDGEEAMELALRAAYWADGVDDVTAMEARLLAARACLFLHRAAEALPIIEAALPDVHRIATTQARAGALDLHAWALAETGDAQGAALAALAAVELVPDGPQRARLSHRAAERLAEAGRVDESAQAYTEATRLWRAEGDLSQVVRARRDHGRLEAARPEPRWDAAVQLFEAAQREADDADDTDPGNGTWAPVERAETRLQFAQLLQEWLDADADADADAGVGTGTGTGTSEGIAERALRMAQEAADRFAALAGPGEVAHPWVLANHCAALLELDHLGRPAAAAARLHAVIAACSGHESADELAEAASWLLAQAEAQAADAGR